MKFRTIFILFNVVIVVSFLFLFFMPLALLGWDYSLQFWKASWYLGLFFLALLGLLNGFFAVNWRVYALLEKEDWSGLAAALVEKIFVRRRFASRDVVLLVDAYILLGDVAGIGRLEEELAERRPKILRKVAVTFALTRLLRELPAEAEAFLQPLLGKRDVDNWEWLRFDYAFALVLQGKVAEALPQLLEGTSSRDPLLSLLAAFFLDTVVLPRQASAEAGAAVQGLRAALLRRFPGKRLDREIERGRGELQIVILSKFLDEARLWLASTT